MREASANESLMTHRKLFDGNQNRGAPLPWEKQPEARSELNLHSDRMARLNRILDIAQDKKDTTLATHAKQVIQREVARDARVMQSLHDKENTR